MSPRPPRRSRWWNPSLRRVVQVALLGVYLWLFFYVAFPPAHVFDAEYLSRAEWLPVESLLWLDPLASVSAALAGRVLMAALAGAAATAALCVLLPRAFCSYVCPLGTLIDAFDWLLGRHARKLHLARPRRWEPLRYGVLAAVMVAAAFGVLLSGFVSPIPVLTRGLLFTAGRAQGGLARGFSSVAPVGWAVGVSVALFAGIFLAGLLGRRAWCRFVCPAGGLLSLFWPLRMLERQVDSSCVGCGRCVEACAFGAIGEDYSTRGGACTTCLSCQRVCPAGSIHLGVRSSAARPQAPEAPRPGRRAFLAATFGGAAVGAATRWGLSAEPPRPAPLRPPGSEPEERFLDLCVRCGLCMQVCPGPVLHPAGLEAGFEALWTPVVVPTRAGCHQDCNFCTQVCPTRAIRPLSLAEKRVARIGTAVVDRATCLPHTGQRDCRLCYEECLAAGYHAIEMRPIRLALGDIPEGTFSEMELQEMSRIEAPFVRRGACVGCGLCEFRCHSQLVRNEKLLARSAVIVVPEAQAPPPMLRQRRRRRGRDGPGADADG